MECAVEHIDIPKELVWDYVEAPMDFLWRLQRIADFFPACGTDRETIGLLFDHVGSLELEEGKSRLIAIYHEAWNDESREKN